MHFITKDTCFNAIGGGGEWSEDREKIDFIFYEKLLYIYFR